MRGELVVGSTQGKLRARRPNVTACRLVVSSRSCGSARDRGRRPRPRPAIDWRVRRPDCLVDQRRRSTSTRPRLVQRELDFHSMKRASLWPRRRPVRVASSASASKRLRQVALPSPSSGIGSQRRHFYARAGRASRDRAAPHRRCRGRDRRRSDRVAAEGDLVRAGARRRSRAAREHEIRGPDPGRARAVRHDAAELRSHIEGRSAR
jgi:hypothetical protein